MRCPFTCQLDPSWRSYQFSLIRASRRRQRREEMIAAVHKWVAGLVEMFANIGVL